MVKIESIRNVVLCGHGHAGKTTLADSFLTMTHAVDGSHSVDNGTSICDFDPEEKKHKYSIEAATVHFDHDGHRLNLIDTPGYPDFIGQVIGPMEAVENALIVIDAHRGIEVNTRRVFREATRAGVGRFIVINKMDDAAIDFPKLIDDVRKLWGNECLLLNVPVGQGDDFRGVINTLNIPDDTTGALVDLKEINEPLIESIIEVDDEVMKRYFEGELPDNATINRLIVKAVREGALIPILCCSSKTGVGVRELLDAICHCGLSPTDFLRSSNNEKEVPVEIKPDAEGPLVAKVFRTRIDPFVQKLNFIRIYSGTLRRDDSVHASTSKKNVRLGPLLEVLGESTSPVDYAGPGDIVAVAKMDDLHTGSVLGDIELPESAFPEPMVSLAVVPKSHADETKISGALQKVLEEDPTFHLDRDVQTKELVMTGMSELHLNVIRERLVRRDKLEVETRQPRIAFHETIRKAGEGSYRHKKQSGGRGQFGEIHVRMMPLPRETDIEEFATKKRFHSMKEYHYDEKANFLWVDSVVGGVIPGNFMPAIGKGFAERIQQGVIAGYPVQDLCVEVHFGKHHQVDSSEAAFRIAAKRVFKQVFENCQPGLLEPIVRLDITVPESNVGDVYSDMSGRHGRVVGSDPAGGNWIQIHAEAPLREVTTYSRSLSSMTGGMGSFTMEFSCYDIVPSIVQTELMADHSEDEDE